MRCNEIRYTESYNYKMTYFAGGKLYTVTNDNSLPLKEIAKELEKHLTTFADFQEATGAQLIDVKITAVRI